MSRRVLTQPPGDRKSAAQCGINKLAKEFRQPVPKNYIDPIEYAQKAMAAEYAARRAQYERENQHGR